MSSFWVLKDAILFEKLVQYLRTLPLGKGLKVYIEKPNKTPAQRAYFHNIVREIATELTHRGDPTSEEWLKIAIKRNFLPPYEVFDKITGEVFTIIRPTETLTKEDYSVMIEKTKAFAAEREIYLKEPDFYGLEIKKGKNEHIQRQPLR
jgi:hypothetical protein